MAKKNKTEAAATAAIREKSNGEKVLARFLARKISVAGLIILSIIVFMALFGDKICTIDPAHYDAKARFLGPCKGHIFGTDDMGRDTLARIIDGAKLTLIITLGSVGIALAGGTTLGLICGFKKGVIDNIVSGFMDSLWAFPAVVLAMAINTALGQSIGNIIIAIGVVNIPDFFRVVRSRVISIREMEYVTGARAIGLSDAKIIWRYVLPNLLSTLIVQLTLTAAKAVLAEAALSFLGLGVPLPRASWGTMLKSGYNLIDRTIWLGIFPGFFIMMLVLSLNFLGDGLRDALDIRIRAD